MTQEEARKRLHEIIDAFNRGDGNSNTAKMRANGLIKEIYAGAAFTQPDIEKLQAFKDFVHRRLDEMGVPTHPDGEHSKAGCRIGDRLDIVQAVFTQPSLKSRLDALTDDQRVEVFGNYCKHCGSKDPRCQCWNDE